MSETLRCVSTLKQCWHYNRLDSQTQNIQNVALTQIVAGVVCLLIQIVLFCWYGQQQQVQSHGIMVLVLSLCCTSAGIFGCFYNGRQRWIRCFYLSSSVLVLMTAVSLLFTTYFWDFFAAFSRAMNDTDDYRPVPGQNDAHFWLTCSLLLCVIIATLFSLAGLCVRLSYRKPKQQIEESLIESSSMEKELSPM